MFNENEADKLARHFEFIIIQVLYQIHLFSNPGRFCLEIFMSKRAEGCGQWLSAKEKRTTSHVAQLPGGKAKKKKGFLKFASRGGQSGGLNIHISCSPLSPRTKKKLKNAKQSKIDNYFNGELGPNGSTNDNRVATASKRAGSQDEKRTKVPIKRQREDSSSGKLRT